MPLTRRNLISSAAAIAATTAGMSKANARTRGMRVSRHRIPWPGDKKLRVLHLTDIHVGWSTPQAVLRRCVEVAHRLEPDVVVLTGDYINRSLKHLPRLTKFVDALPDPVFAVLGNHDHWGDAHQVSMALRRGGAEVLTNRTHGIDGPGWSLPIVGVDDGLTGHADVELAFSGGEDPERTLVLNHFPTTANEIAGKGARLILSGHTHGGQIVLPYVTQAVHRLAGNTYLHGFYTLGDSQLYVSAGIGHSLEGLRGGHTAMPEIAVFELDPSAKDRRSRGYRTRLRGA